MEREVLWRIAPHIIWPLRFVLPHHAGLRPAWLLRLGLFLYDHLGGRKLLPPTRTLDLHQRSGRQAAEAAVHARPSNIPTAGSTMRGWSCSTRATPPTRGADDPHAHHASSARAAKAATGRSTSRTAGDGAKTVAARGCWSTPPAPGSTMCWRQRRRSNAAATSAWCRAPTSSCRKLFEHDPRAYIFQNADGRIVFAIPYEERLHADRHHRPRLSRRPGAGGDQRGGDRLSLRRRERVFRRAGHARPTSSGPIPACGRSTTTAPRRRRRRRATTCWSSTARDGEPPLLSIFGGKITTYRRLAESAGKAASRSLPDSGKPAGPAARRCPAAISRRRLRRAWSAKLTARVSVSRRGHAAPAGARLRHRARAISRRRDARADLGRDFGAGLTEAEVRYLMRAGMGADRRRRAVAPLQARPATQPPTRRSALEAFMAARAGAAAGRRQPSRGRWRELAARLDNVNEAVAGADRDVSLTLRARLAQRAARADTVRQDHR